MSWAQPSRSGRSRRRRWFRATGSIAPRPSFLLAPRLLSPSPRNGGEGRGEGVAVGPDRVHIGQNRPGRYLTGFPVRQGGPLPMPWKETCAMDEKMSFIVGRLKGDLTMTELCEQFGISRD